MPAAEGAKLLQQLSIEFEPQARAAAAAFGAERERHSLRERRQPRRPVAAGRFRHLRHAPLLVRDAERLVDPVDDRVSAVCTRELFDEQVLGGAVEDGVVDVGEQQPTPRRRHERQFDRCLEQRQRRAGALGDEPLDRVVVEVDVRDGRRVADDPAQPAADLGEAGSERRLRRGATASTATQIRAASTSPRNAIVNGRLVGGAHVGCALARPDRLLGAGAGSARLVTDVHPRPAFRRWRKDGVCGLAGTRFIVRTADATAHAALAARPRTTCFQCYRINFSGGVHET